MSTAPFPLLARPHRNPGRVLLAAGIVAVLDLVYAEVLWVGILKAATPIQIPQSIAAGLLGRASYEGGALTAAVGVVLHCLIAYGWTVVYLFLVRHWRAFRSALRTPGGTVRVGLAYGAFVWLAMTLVVLPLSRTNAPPVFQWRYLVNLVQQALMVGLPIAFLLKDGES